MALQRSSGPMRRTPIKKVGQRTLEWKKFRNAKFDRDKDEEGLVRCQDVKAGLTHCGVSSIAMDLHHLKGRDGELLTDERHLVWLTRFCHDKTHSFNPHPASCQTTDDKER